MNREILFRGKRKDSGEWIYGNLMIDTADCQLKAEGKCFCPHDGSYAEIYHWLEGLHEYDGDEVVPDTIGQYTGLTDKNGKKIFEGDIVKTEILDGDDWFDVRYGICGGTKNVLHEVGYIGFYLQPASKAAKEYSSVGLRNDIVYWIKKEEGVEVIGNIHDNPELLEGGGEK